MKNSKLGGKKSFEFSDLGVVLNEEKSIHVIWTAVSAVVC